MDSLSVLVEVTSELTAEPCPATAWDCMFMRTDMVLQEAPGGERRVQESWYCAAGS